MNISDFLKKIDSRTMDFIKIIIEKQRIESKRSSELKIVKGKYLSKLSEKDLQRIYE